MTKLNLKKQPDIVANLKLVTILKQKVIHHHLCFDLKETNTHYICIFPYTVNELGGIRIQKSNSKSKALEKLYSILENRFA